MRLPIIALAAIAAISPASHAGFVWLDNQWDVTFDMNMDKGEGSKQRGFGDVTSDIAIARAEALASTDPGGGNSKYQAEVDFDRRFQLSGSPAGWIATLQGVLSGSLSVVDPNEASSAFVLGTAIVLDANQVPIFSVDTGETKNDNGADPWFQIATEGMKLDDGDYSVRGQLVTSALVLNNELRGSAESLFYGGGFAVSLVTQPLPEPSTYWTVLVFSSLLLLLTRRRIPVLPRRVAPAVAPVSNDRRASRDTR